MLPNKDSKGWNFSKELAELLKSPTVSQGQIDILKAKYGLGSRVRGTTLTEFSNPCHSPDDGRFCETPGTGRDATLDATENARRNQIAKQIIARRVQEGKKPLSRRLPTDLRD